MTPAFDAEFKTDLMKLLAAMLGCTVEEAEEKALKRVAAFRKRARARHVRYEEALSRTTDLQAARSISLEAKGNVFNCLYLNKKSENVAIVYHRKGVFDTMTLKMSEKISIIYPDGSVDEFMGKSFKIRPTY